MKKIYVHEIAAVNLSKIDFLKNAKKTCKPNNSVLNRDCIYSTPVLRVDKVSANDLNKKYIDLLKEAKLDCIFNNNITESILISTGYILMSQDLLFSQRI